MSRPQTIAVIGAGVSGLACARFAQEAGARVRVFERGARLGGRCATRRATLDGTAMQWDYGAQFIAASDPEFAAWIAPRTDSWNGFRVGVPGMDALPAALAMGLDVVIRSDVLGVWREGAGWQLSVVGRGSVGTSTEGPFDAVALALPAPVAARLLPVKLAAALAGVEMAPIWTSMLAFAAAAGIPATAHAQDGPLTWVFRDSDKPGRQAEAACWAVQGGPGWSAAHADRPATEVAGIATHAFRAANDLPEPLYAAAHRWTYALVRTPLGGPCLVDPVARIGACGDWCLGARLQDAWLSGRALAAALLQ